MNRGLCLAWGSDGRGRHAFAPATCVIKLVPSITGTGSSEQPSLTLPQLSAAVNANQSPSALCHYHINSSTLQGCPYLQCPLLSKTFKLGSAASSRRLQRGCCSLQCFASGLNWDAGLPTLWHLPITLGCQGKRSKVSPMHWERNHRTVLKTMKYAPGSSETATGVYHRGRRGNFGVIFHSTSSTSWYLGRTDNLHNFSSRP